MIFNVTIPSKSDTRYGTTFQVDAANWILALQTGLHQEGTSLHPMEGFHVEVAEGRVAVTDPRSRRVYRIVRAQDMQRRAEQVQRAATGAHGAIKKPDTGDAARPQAPRLSPGGTGGVMFKDRHTGSFRAIGASPSAAMPAPEAEATGRILTESRTATSEVDAKAAAAAADAPRTATVSESALEDVFLDIMTIFEPNYPLEDAIDFVLELGKKAIPCEHGALFFANDDASSLYVATAFGPSRARFLDAEVSILEGLPALAMREGFTVNVSNPATDNRHTPELEERAGIKATSLICAPVQFEGRAFGAITLINRENASFAPEEANILAYIGQQMGKFIQMQLDAQPL